MAGYRSDLIYPELSYQVIGASFDVYNTLGSGHKEKFYEEALAEELANRKIYFKRQLSYPLIYKNKILGRTFLDFLIEGKLVVEIKKGSRFSKRNIDQVLNYLRVHNLSLAILINFGSEGVQFKRIINIIN